MGNENNEKSQVYRELLIFALGELICLALMLGIFALLGRLDGKVLLGGAIGAGGASAGSTSNNTAANASQAHNNMPPYKNVYIWERTA